MSWDECWRIDGTSLDEVERAATELLRARRHPSSRAPEGGVDGKVTRPEPEALSIDLVVSRDLVVWDSPQEQLDLLKEIDPSATTIAGDIQARIVTDDGERYIRVSVGSASANRYSWYVTTAIAAALVRRLGGHSLA